MRNRDLRPGPGSPDPTVLPLGCPGLRWGRGRIWKGRWKTRPITPLAPPDLPTLCRCRKLRGHQLPCHGQLLIWSSVRLNPKASTCSPGGCLKSWCLGAQTGGSGPRPCVFVGHHCPLTVVPHRRSCPITKHCLSSDRRCERPPPGCLKQQVYLLVLEARSQIKCGQAGPLDASRHGLQVAPSPHECLLVCFCGSQSGPLETALSPNVTFRGVWAGGVRASIYDLRGNTGQP